MKFITIKHLFKTKRWTIVILLITCLLTAFFLIEKKKDTPPIKNASAQTKHVLTKKVSELTDNNTIEAIGLVKPKTKVNVVALTGGTVQTILFKIGDEVKNNQILAQIHNNSLVTKYNTAKSNYTNMVQSLHSNIQSNAEAVKQAELGIKTAQESVKATSLSVKKSAEAIHLAELGVLNAQENIKSAEIALKTAQDNLNNSLNLQNKTYLDTQDNAIITYGDYLNTINNTLNQINTLIHAESDQNYEGINQFLSIQNPTKIDNAKEKYLDVKLNYHNLKTTNPNRQTITQAINSLTKTLLQTKELVDLAVEVLNNTVAAGNYNESWIINHKSSFANLRASVVAKQTQAKHTLTSLENISLTNKQQIDALKNTVKSAENKLSLAKVGYSNALASLNNAKLNHESSKSSLNSTKLAYENALLNLEFTKQKKDQSVTGSQNNIDTTKGQYYLVAEQLNDLTVKAPIAGFITDKFVEIGTEITPGQKIAEISQIDMVKIEINLTAEEVNKIQQGEKVIINENLKGTINSISPSADPITKKVLVEIIFDNQNKNLIANTFANIKIPTNQLTSDQKTLTFLVPLQAVTINQTETFVFVINEGKAVKKQVILNKIQGTKVEVIKGLKPEDLLVVEGNKTLLDGDNILEN